MHFLRRRGEIKKSKKGEKEKWILDINSWGLASCFLKSYLDTKHKTCLKILTADIRVPTEIIAKQTFLNLSQNNNNRMPSEVEDEHEKLQPLYLFCKKITNNWELVIGRRWPAPASPRAWLTGWSTSERDQGPMSRGSLGPLQLPQKRGLHDLKHKTHPLDGLWPVTKQSWIGEHVI